ADGGDGAGVVQDLREGVGRAVVAEVCVAVDHARQEGEAGAVDHYAVADRGGLAGRADPGDAVTFHHDGRVPHRLAAEPVDQGHPADQVDRAAHAVPPVTRVSLPLDGGAARRWDWLSGDGD